MNLKTTRRYQTFVKFRFVFALFIFAKKFAKCDQTCLHFFAKRSFAGNPSCELVHVQEKRFNLLYYFD